MVQKAVNAEAKAGLRFSIMVQDSDIRCCRGHRFSNSTISKVQTQGTTTKDFSRPEKPKPKKTKSVRADVAEPLEQNKKDKKDCRDKKRRFQEKKERSNTLATSDNAIDTSKKKKKNRDCTTSRVTCYNCNKKGYFANTYTKPKN